MNKLKNKKGITLVALVVTIVVLLILAGISINILLGDNGIIKRATGAKEEYSKSSAKEKVEFLITDYVTDKATGENEDFARFLRKNLQVGVAENDDDTYSFMLGKYQVTTTDKKVVSIEEFSINVDKIYSSVADMKTDTSLTTGQLVQTEGYYSKKYGGSAYYDIVSETDLTADEAKCIALNNGLYAIIHAINDTITVNQYGAYGDGEHDDSTTIQTALNSGYGNVTFESERYKFGKTINLTTDNTSVIGNNATLFWDEETVVVFSQVLIIGTSLEHVQDISMYYLNFENNYIDMGNVTESVQLLCKYCDNIDIENCNFSINELSNDTSRKITNTWFDEEWSNINIKNCNYTNLTYGNVGGNVWFSSDNTENPNYISQNVKIENNQFEKSCHDESIAIWSGKIKDIIINNNIFNLIEDNVESPSDINFTFGNTGGIVENIKFTNNKVISESNYTFAICNGESESKNIYIYNNDIKWTLLNKSIVYSGFIANENTENLIIYENNIEYSSKSDGYLYVWAKDTTGTEYKSNNLKINGNINSLMYLNNDQYSNTNFVDNNININGNIAFLYEGYEFSGNDVKINGEVGGIGNQSKVLFRYYSKILYGDVNINNNKIYIKNQGNINLPFLFLYNSKINGYSINLTNNDINYDTTGIGTLTHIQNMLDERQQKININDNDIIGYKQVYFLNNIINPIVIFNGREITTNTVLE